MAIKQIAYRVNRLALVALILVTMSLPLSTQQNVNAYGLPSERAIKMSSSALAATSVSYEVTFKPATTGLVKSVAVDFCQNTPVINDSCTGTVGTNTPTLTSATVTTTGAPNNFSTLTWTVTLVNTNRTFTIANSTGENLTAGTAYTFTINLVTNPTDNDTVNAGNQPGTFYSRFLTFPGAVLADGNYAGGYTGTNVGTNVPTDAGGIALSTANEITITAKVPERLTFCVYTTGTGNDCSSKTGTAVTLGDNNGVLSDVEEFINANAKYSVSTNALFNVAIRVKGDTLETTPSCALASCRIEAIGTPAALNNSGSEQFGFCTYQSTGTGLSPQAPYTDALCTGANLSPNAGSPGDTIAGNAANGSRFGFDNNTTDGTNSTYGDIFATKTAGSFSTGVIAFIGNISTTTEPGIYTTTLTFIATGTY